MTGPSPAANKPIAIACTLAAVACFAALDTTTKSLASAVPVVMVVWFRYLFQVLLTVATAEPSRRRQLSHSRRPGLQILRGALLITATVIAFYSLKFMPVAEFTAVVTLTPLFVTLLAVWRLGERVTPLEWVLVLVNAVFQMLTRRLAEVDDAVTTQFYTGCIGAAAATLALPWAWQMPHDLRVWGQLLLLCVFGTVGHLLLIMAYARAPVATMTPFLYFQIAFATAAGWLVFGQVPDAMAFAGILLIGLCGSLGTWLASRQIVPGARSEGLP